MAVFLLKAKHGAGYMPPACTGVFADVPCPSLFADWIEELYAEGITGGCGAGNYCPANPVTRAQMAAFLLKASHGSALRAAPLHGRSSPTCCARASSPTGSRSSPPRGSPEAAAPESTARTSPNTRGQMAVFLVKTFGLLLYGP